MHLIMSLSVLKMKKLSIHLVIILIVLSIACETKGKSFKIKIAKEKIQPYIDIDFATEVKRFCDDKPKTNFCSQNHIEMMLEIERQRLAKLELARQLKRMKNEIIRKVFNFNLKSINMELTLKNI